MRYQRVVIREETVLFDTVKWGDTSRYFAVSSDCQTIAVRPLQSDGDENIYLYNNSGKELKNLSHSSGQEAGIIFWPDNNHLLIPGYNLNKYQITIIQYSLRDDSLQYPFENTVLEGTSQHIIGSSKSGRYLAGWSSSPNSRIRCWYYDQITEKLQTGLNFASTVIFSDRHNFALFTQGYSYAPFAEENLYLINLLTDEHLIPPSPSSFVRSDEIENFVCFAADRDQCIFSSRNKIIIRRLSDLQIIRSIEVDFERATSAYISFGGELYFFGCVNGDILAIDSNDFTCVGRYISGGSPAPDVAIQQVVVSSDNKTLIATNQNKVLVFSLHYA